MITITVDNSNSKIEGLSIEQHKKLRTLLSYTKGPIGNKYFEFKYSKQVTLLGKSGKFPTGLLSHVIDYVRNVPHTYNDLRRIPMPRPKLFTMKLAHTPYPEQIEAVRAFAHAQRGIISAPTGVGKSLIIALAIQSMEVRTLVVVPSIELKRQLTSSLSDIFGSENVGKGKNICVENVGAFKLNDKTNKQSASYDFVIIDEFHHSGAKTYRKLNDKCWNHIYYRLGLTATPFRSQEEENILLESVLEQVIYKIDYQTAVDKGYIVPVDAYYIDVPVTQSAKNLPNNWKAVYSAIVVNNEVRNDLITNLLIKLHANKLSTLCLVKEIAHGEILVNDGAFSFVNGQNDERHLITGFAEGHIGTLIGTTGIIGEGIDTKAAEYVIIAGLGKSKNQIMQQIGRGVRKYGDKESCKVILFNDRSHVWTRRHFQEQCKILKEEYNCIPAKLEL